MKNIYFISMLFMAASAGTVLAQQTVTTTTVPSQSTTFTQVHESSGPFQISLQGGGLWEQKSSRLHRGGEILGRLAVDLTPNLAIGAEAGGLTFVDESNGIKYGHLNGVPVMADLILKAPIQATGNHLVPYVYGAAGVMNWYYSKSSYSKNVGLDAPTRTDFAFKPGAGIEYYVTPNISIFIEASYLYSPRYKFKNSSSTPPNSKINANAIYGGGGIKINF